MTDETIAVKAMLLNKQMGSHSAGHKTKIITDCEKIRKISREIEEIKNMLLSGSIIGQIGIVPSIVHQESGVLTGEDSRLTIVFDEPVIYITGVHASFDGNGCKGTIEIYLEPSQADGGAAEKDILYSHSFWPNCDGGGEFNALFPNLIIMNDLTGQPDRIIKAGLKVVTKSECRSKNVKAELTVMTSILPLDGVLQKQYQYHESNR